MNTKLAENVKNHMQQVSRPIIMNQSENSDLYGLKTTNSSLALEEVYARALRAFNCYRGDPVEIIDEALSISPNFIMGIILRAHVHISLWEKSIIPELDSMLEKLQQLAPQANDREQRHITALAQWRAGDWNKARITLDYLSVDYPRDLLALQAGHLADFFHGDRENLRGRIARSLPHWSLEDPGYGFLLGLHAFGLEECAAYEQAEDAGRRALDLQPEDCWAQHAVAHVMEMQCRQDEGIAFMLDRKAHWAQEDNGFMFHNWWHTALFHLDQGKPETALEIYDEGIRPEPSNIQMTMLDAAAMLWRMHLQTIDVGHRWEELASLYEHDDEAGFYVFNDMHAMMALVATGRHESAERRLASAKLAAQIPSTNASMSQQVGLNILSAIHAFGHGNYSETVELLMPIRHRAFIFGGSHAQRDIIHRTLIEAAHRDNNNGVYSALNHERAALRPNCPFTWGLKNRTAIQT